MDWNIKRADKGLKGAITVPSDKSISHRAIMFSSIAKGECRVKNFLFSEDCICTLEAFRAMGVEIIKEDDVLVVKGKGLSGLNPPEEPLYMGNSGTSMRILSGILAGQTFEVKLEGDESLSRRPMKRIKDPLLLMGAEVGTLNGLCPPIHILPAREPLRAIDYITPVPSAQVKSCVLSAGLYAEGTTSVTENVQSRDHTERMLEYFSADIQRQGLTTRITGLKELTPKDINVPGDISSAAFLIVAALLVEGSDILLKRVGLNPTRTGLLTVLERMGAEFQISDRKDDVEPVGDIRVTATRLKGTIIEPEEIPLLIDEIPVVVVAALMAEGRTEIRGISELKVKESDRVKSIIENIAKLGITIYEENRTLLIDGGCKSFPAARLESFGDHRIAMSMAVAALVSDRGCEIRDTACVDTSYPAFLGDLEDLSRYSKM